MLKKSKILFEYWIYVSVYLIFTAGIIGLDSVGLVSLIGFFSNDKPLILGYELGFGLEIIAMIFFAKGLFKVISEAVKVRIQQMSLFSFSSDVLSRLNLMPLHKVDSFISRLTSGLGVEMERFSKNIISQIIILETLTGAIIYIIVSTAINFKLTMIALLLGSLSSLLFRFLSRKIKYFSIEFSEKMAKSGSTLRSLFDSFEFLKLNNLLQDFVKDIAILRFKEQEIKRARVGYFNSIVLGLREPVLIVVLILTIIIAKNTGSSMGEIGASLLLLYRAVTYINIFQLNISKFYETYGSIDVLNTLKADLIKVTLSTNKNRSLIESLISVKSENNDKSWALSSLRLTSSKYVQIEGESGVGKSSFLRVLAGENYPWISVREGVKPLESHTLAYLPQDSEFINSEFYDYLNSRNEFDADFFEKASNMLLPDVNNISGNLNSLSGGEKKRLLICLLLALRRKHLLLDEPLSGLDNNNRSIVLDLIGSIQELKAVIFTSHVNIQFDNEQQSIRINYV